MDERQIKREGKQCISKRACSQGVEWMWWGITLETTGGIDYVRDTAVGHKMWLASLWTNETCYLFLYDIMQQRVIYFLNFSLSNCSNSKTRPASEVKCCAAWSSISLIPFRYRIHSILLVKFERSAVFPAGKFVSLVFEFSGFNLQIAYIGLS